MGDAALLHSERCHPKLTLGRLKAALSVTAARQEAYVFCSLFFFISFSACSTVPGSAVHNGLSQA